MWHQNQLTQLLGIDYPIIQAPMAGGVTTPQLVASVANSGGLGSLGAAYMTPEDIQNNIHAIRKLTDKPFAVNLFAPETCSTSRDKQLAMCTILNDVCKELDVQVKPAEPPFSLPFDEQLAVIIEQHVAIFSFTFGNLEKKYFDQLKRHNIKIIGTATSLNEATALQDAGVDAIVAQGIEAGGHQGTFAGNQAEPQNKLMPLVTHGVNHLNVPIIAAGGIADATGMMAALKHGAQAVQIGSAFLTTTESGAHPKYKEILLNTTADNTRLTKVFSGRLARVINNKFVELMQPHERDICPFPLQNKLTKQIRNAASEQNNPEFMSLWAGQNASLCKAVSASNLVKELIKDLTHLK